MGKRRDVSPMPNKRRQNEIKKAQARIKNSNLASILLSERASSIWAYFRDNTTMSSGEITSFLFSSAKEIYKFQFTDRRRKSRIKSDLMKLVDAAKILHRFTRIENGKFNEGNGLKIINTAIFEKIGSAAYSSLFFKLAGIFEDIIKRSEEALRKLDEGSLDRTDPMNLPQYQYLSQKPELSGYAARAVINVAQSFPKQSFSNRSIADIVRVFIPRANVKEWHVNNIIAYKRKRRTSRQSSDRITRRIVSVIKQSKSRTRIPALQIGGSRDAR